MTISLYKRPVTNNWHLILGPVHAYADHGLRIKGVQGHLVRLHFFGGAGIHHRDAWHGIRGFSLHLGLNCDLATHDDGRLNRRQRRLAVWLGRNGNEGLSVSH